MKKYIFLIGCMLLMLVSCQTSVLDPLEGIFTPPTVSEDFSIVKCDAYKSEGKRIFELHLGGPVTLQATLVGDAYYLTSNAYTEATEANAKKGNFILGKTSVNGAQVETGTITVTQEDFSYRIKAILFVAGGAAYKLSWSGNLQFEPDPEPVVLTKLLIAQANGNNTVTFKLGTDDMGLDMMGTPEGNGFALTADVYSADGFLAEGVYTPAIDHDNVGPGQYAPGYEYDLSEWGMGIMHWGTCWWEWPTVTHIDKEPITVTKKGSKFTITWGSEETYPNWATFTGEIPELTPSDVPAPDYTYTDDVTDAVDESSTPVAGVKSHNLTLLNAAGEEVAWFQLILAEGVTNYAGEYLCKEYAHEAYTFGNGYDFRSWGWDLVGGSRYMKDGELVLINPGETISVSRLGDDIWEIIGNGFDFVFGTGGGEVVEPQFTITDDVTDAVDESSTPVAGVKTHNLTLWNAAGEECVWFQLVLKEGETELAGEYLCKEYAHEEYTFGNGYDFRSWGWDLVGGSRYMKDGELVLINPEETLTITKVGEGIYKFSGSTGYEFVGEF